MSLQDKSVKNGTLHILYAKLYILLSVDSSTNRCNETLQLSKTVVSRVRLEVGEQKPPSRIKNLTKPALLNVRMSRFDATVVFK